MVNYGVSRGCAECKKRRKKVIHSEFVPSANSLELTLTQCDELRPVSHIIKLQLHGEDLTVGSITSLI